MFNLHKRQLLRVEKVRKFQNLMHLRLSRSHQSIPVQRPLSRKLRLRPKTRSSIVRMTKAEERLPNLVSRRAQTQRLKAILNRREAVLQRLKMRR